MDLGNYQCQNEVDSCNKNGGQCYTFDGVMCYCRPDWYGDYCENKRHDVRCSKSAIFIYFKPYSDFNGDVYIKGHKHTAGCSFKTSDLPSGKAGLALDIEDSNCGAVTIDKDTGARSRAVIIQHNPKYVTSIDTELTVTCTVGSGTVDVTNVISTDGNTEKKKISNVTDVESPVINFFIKTKDGTKVQSSSSVSLDEVLTFEFNNDKTLEAIRVESCTADNRQTGENLETLKIIENSCSSSEVKELMKQMLTRSTKTTVTFQIKAFKFADVLDVSVSCTIRVCPFGAGSECDGVTNCDGGKPGFGRKRRSVDGTNVTYVRKSFTIRESILTRPSGKPETLGETKEFTASVTTLTVAVSAVVIVILIATIIVIVVVLLRKQANRKSKVQDANQKKQIA